MTVEAIQAAAAATAECATQDCSPVPPSAEATARFDQAMAVQGAAPVAAVAPPTAPEAPAPASFGDSILSGLHRISGEMRSAWSAAEKAVQLPDMSVTDLLKVQLQVIQVSWQFDLVGKFSSRSTQNLDQLVRLQ